jgi:hypothetical protein
VFCDEKKDRIDELASCLEGKSVITEPLTNTGKVVGGGEVLRRARRAPMRVTTHRENPRGGCGMNLRFPRKRREGLQCFQLGDRRRRCGARQWWASAIEGTAARGRRKGAAEKNYGEDDGLLKHERQ